MSKLTKLGLVTGGYVLACLVGGGVVYIHQWLTQITQNAAAQASAGMYAFGDLFLFIAVAGFLMLFPTGLALFFLVRYIGNR